MREDCAASVLEAGTHITVPRAQPLGNVLVHTLRPGLHTQDAEEVAFMLLFWTLRVVLDPDVCWSFRG